jgi:hypothetical protein
MWSTFSEMKSRATIVISYFNSCPYRKRNFELIVSLITQAKIPLVIVEQVNSSDSKEIKVKEYRDLIHVSYFSQSLFHKSKLYNISIDHVKTSHIWFLDADVMLPFEKIVPKIFNQQIIRPFGGVYLLTEGETDKVFDNKKLDLSNKVPCKFFGKHSFVITKNQFIDCDMFDESFLGWGWEDLDFVQSKAARLDPIVFEDFEGIHLFHPTAQKNNERANYNIYLQNKNQRKILSYCLAISDINSFDQSRFHDIIKNNKSQEESINFNILMLGDGFEDIISWATSNFEQELLSKYIALFHSKAQFKNEIAIANTSIYLSQGEIFSYLKDLPIVSSGMTQDIILGLYKGDALAFSDPKYSIFAYRRSFFDSINGYNDSFNFIDSNKDLIKRSVSPESRQDPSTFGCRDGLMYFDLFFNELKYF